MIREIHLVESRNIHISHPEDLIFDAGSAGLEDAINALQTSKDNPSTVSIKFDGSPVIVWGRDESGQFVFNDRVRFLSKSGAGIAKTSKEVYNSIIAKDPEDVSRQQYAQQLAKMFMYLKRSTPEELRGYIQAEVLWFTTPQINPDNNSYEFKPNKIQYSVPVISDLGERIGRSEMGIVVHSFFDDPNNPSPTAASPEGLGLTPPRSLVILNTKIDKAEVTTKEVPELILAKHIINQKGHEIDMFLNKSSLQTHKISDFAALMKTFAAKTAASGKLMDNGSEKFIQWLSSNQIINAGKVERMISYIKANKTVYDEIWNLVELITKAKYEVKGHYDRQASLHIAASKDEKAGHEGFVADTPHGRIKLVDRPTFMQKPNQVTESTSKKKALTESSSNQDPQHLDDDKAILPPEPGAAPIPPRTVRLYHYTRDMNTAKSILTNGLQSSFARGDDNSGGGASAGIWASSQYPEGSLKAVVEFYAKPEQISRRAQHPSLGADVVQWVEDSKPHSLIMEDDIPASQIIAIHFTLA
jgi:hypothetical protein